MSPRRSSEARTESPCYDSDHRIVDQWIAQDPTFAVELLQRLSLGNQQVRMAIELSMAAGRSPDHPDVGRLCGLIQRALKPDRHMTWRDEDAHWLRVADVVTVIEALAVRGHHVAVRQCCEVAIDALEEAFSFVDEGVSHTESYLLLTRIHLDACRCHPPDRGDLRVWLERKERDSVIGAFAGAATRYRKALDDVHDDSGRSGTT
ncbi:MAG: hypothetical protein H0W72_08665 [Planctomycetes bacterium]|nr:hypothetical protein [Planctomycetota bacterium]